MTPYSKTAVTTVADERVTPRRAAARTTGRVSTGTSAGIADARAASAIAMPSKPTPGCPNRAARPPRQDDRRLHRPNT